MAFLSVSIQIQNGTELQDKLAKLHLDLLDFSAPLKEIGNELKTLYAQDMDTQGSLLNLHWKGLALSTRRYKDKHWPAHATTPLIASGAMQRSFQSTSDKNSLTIDNVAPYFKYHQSSEPRTKIPYRPMLVITDDVQKTVQTILNADIAEKVGKV